MHNIFVSFWTASKHTYTLPHAFKNRVTVRGFGLREFARLGYGNMLVPDPRQTLTSQMRTDQAPDLAICSEEDEGKF